MFHDLMYRYGFTERSGNFQQYNFKMGGKEGDGLIANVQDGIDQGWYGMSNIATPPDGRNPVLR